jgi:predicted Fe-S protein YdhL (DUF1289 family)
MNSKPICIASPCIGLCLLNNDDICAGCFRSIDEITLWTQVDEKTRQQFLVNAENRKQQN